MEGLEIMRVFEIGFIWPAIQSAKVNHDRSTMNPAAGCSNMEICAPDNPNSALRQWLPHYRTATRTLKNPHGRLISYCRQMEIRRRNSKIRGRLFQ